MPSYQQPTLPPTQFSLLHRSLLQSSEFPFQTLLSEQRIAEIFEQEQISFGEDEDAVYTPAITLWGLLSQAFFKAEQRSCLAAVVRIAALWLTLGRTVSSTNTGSYCRARRKITGEVLRKVSAAIATHAFAQAHLAPAAGEGEWPGPDAGIGPASEYTGGRLVIVDGFTVTAADTPDNQAEYPQNPAQKEGLGFPILRGVALVCMRSGLLLDAAVGPYSGKGTGETALLWKLLDALRAGDILVADSYYCTYWLLAECRRRGIHVVMRNHHLRDDSPADARRLVKGQCIAVWTRPPRPAWMDEATYATMPESLEVRLVESHNEQAGQRTEKLTIATTLLDYKLYDAAWLAGIYRGRWRVELDIRAIKVTLGMDVLRAKTPEMVRTELWSCLLVYNLLRESMLQGARASGRTCRTLSLTATLQMLGNLWLCAAIQSADTELRTLFQTHHIALKVGNRPGRNEPRVNKRRPKMLKLMTEPRPKKPARQVA
jgi:DDE family transposase